MHSPEWHEKKDIDKFLVEAGIFSFAPATGGFGKSGTPDRICCYQGQFFGIEVKREGKEPTALQWKRMGEIEAAGGRAFWGTADKVIPEIKAWIASL